MRKPNNLCKLIKLVRSILERNVEGAFAELGVYRGETARLLHHYCYEGMI